MKALIYRQRKKEIDYNNYNRSIEQLQKFKSLYICLVIGCSFFVDKDFGQSVGVSNFMS